MITVQAGLVGLAAFLWLLVVQWRSATRMSAPNRYLAEGLVLAFVLSSLFNSALLNSPEGHFYGFLTAFLFACSTTRRVDTTGT